MSDQATLESSVDAEPEVTKSLTEADVLAMLRERLCKPGNGGAGEYALIPQVRNGAGFNANRTFDAVAVSLWPSRGHTIDCFEIKCSRSDWLRELKDPAKAEAAARFCDRFWIVASDSSIVKDGELPPTWGLLVGSGGKLRSVVAAPMLPDADPTRPIPRSFLVPLLRSAGGVPAVPAEVQAARRKGIEEGRQLAIHEVDRIKSDAEELRELVAAFEDASGVTFGRWGRTEQARKIGSAVKSVMASTGAEDEAKRRLTAARAALEAGLKAIDQAIGAR